MTGYRYTDRDLLAVREDYFYSAIQGPSFFNDFATARNAVSGALPAGAVRPKRITVAAYPASESGRIETKKLLDALESKVDDDWLEKLVQRFEVTKRIYTNYDGNLRAPGGGADDLRLYARLACVLGDEVQRTGDLRWLNALLKLNDLLCSQSMDRLQEVAGTLRYSLEIEQTAIEQLLERGGQAGA